MLKLSRNLLDNMDRFAIERAAAQARPRRDAAAGGSRRRGLEQDSREYELAEVSRS
jgi:hypothetical protein